MLFYIGILTQYSTQVRYSQGDESDGPAYTHRAGYQAHNRKQLKGFEIGRELRLFLEVGGEFRRRADGGDDSHCEQCEREDYVGGSDSFQAEIGRSPEVVLLEELSVRGVGDHDGAERADEGSEQDSEGDEVLGVDL